MKLMLLIPSLGLTLKLVPILTFTGTHDHVHIFFPTLTWIHFATYLHTHIHIYSKTSCNRHSIRQTPPFSGRFSWLSVKLRIHERVKWFANHSQTVCKLNARMCGWDVSFPCTGCPLLASDSQKTDKL